MYVHPAFSSETKTVADAKFIGAFDVSGSMGGMRSNTLFRVLNELGLTYQNIYTWADKVTWSATKSRIVTLGCGGGTDPNCLLTTQAFNSAATGNEIFIFSTDGEIDTDILKKFSVGMKKSFAMVICIIVGEDGRNLTQVNMSVVSPFLSSPNVCVYLSPTSCKLVSSTLPQFESISTATKISELPTVELKDVVRGEIRERLPAAPDDVLIGDQYVKLDQLDKFTIQDFAKIDFSALALRMKTQGTASKLRTALKNLQMAIVAPSSSAPRIGQAEETALMEAIAGQPEAANITELQSQLRKVRMERHSKQHEQHKRGATNVAVRNDNKLISEWLVILNEVESVGYTADEMNKIASNRIRRLNNVTNPAVQWNYVGALRQTCKICGTEPNTNPAVQSANSDGVMALMLLTTPSNDNRLTTDLCINDYYVTFPLGFDKLIISPWRVCVTCAQCLTDNCLDPNRQPIIGFIPAVDVSMNKQAFSYRVNSLIGAGKKCYHTYKVLYAALEVLGATAWGSKPKFVKLREFVQVQIYCNTKDRIGMKEIGAVVPTAKAFLSMIEQQQEANLLCQPFYSAMIVLSKIPAQYSERVQKLARKSFIRHLVEKYNLYLKNPEGRSIKRTIRKELFKAPHGVPILNTARITSFAHSSALSELSDNLKYLQYLLTKNDIDIDDELYSVVLACVCSLGTHDKLEAQLELLLAKQSDFMILYEEDILPGKDSLIECIKDSLLPNARFSDRKHSATVPPFITPAGPSKIVCSCGVRFDTNGKDNIDETRKAHFTSVHGSYLPTTNSSHFNLHASIRSVMGKHPTADTPTRALVIEVLADLHRRKKGNIYINELCNDVVVALRSYFVARARFPEISPVDTNEDALIKRFPHLRYHVGPRGAHGTDLLIELELKYGKPEYYQVDISSNAVLEAPFNEEDQLLFDTIYKH